MLYAFVRVSYGLEMVQARLDGGLFSCGWIRRVVCSVCQAFGSNHVTILGICYPIACDNNISFIFFC